jgi:hypothetical protein
MKKPVKSSQPFPNLSDLREKVIAQLEQQCLTDLIYNTKGDTKSLAESGALGNPVFMDF